MFRKITGVKNGFEETKKNLNCRKDFVTGSLE